MIAVENARIYTLPESPPPILVAAAGPRSLELAGRIGDGLVALSPEREIVGRFEEAGGEGKPRYGQLHVCVAASEADARRTACEFWPNAGVPGALNAELALPSHFEAATGTVREDDVAASVICGPEADRHIQAILEFVEAGYDHVYVHQVGPDQDALFDLYGSEVLPELARAAERAAV